jgi:cell division protein FtsZ
MELEILTVAVVTKPFKFEGRRRMQQAEQGLAELRGCVDTIITIPNAKLKEVEEKISITDAFKRADDILLQAVEGISNLITIPGLINLDFADVKSVMERMGMALMGVGRARGEGSAMTAMKAAIDSKLLEENSIRGARGALVNITCGKDMPLDEIEEAVELIHEEADDDANIIFGAVIEESLKDEVKVTVIATGFDREAAASAMPAYAPSVATPPIPMRPATENPLHKKPKVEDLDIPTFIRKQAD